MGSDLTRGRPWDQMDCLTTKQLCLFLKMFAVNRSISSNWFRNIHQNPRLLAKKPKHASSPQNWPKVCTECTLTVNMRHMNHACAHPFRLPTLGCFACALAELSAPTLVCKLATNNFEWCFLLALPIWHLV